MNTSRLSSRPTWRQMPNHLVVSSLLAISCIRILYGGPRQHVTPAVSPHAIPLNQSSHPSYQQGKPASEMEQRPRNTLNSTAMQDQVEGHGSGSNNNNIQHTQLHFIHIPKTGGTSIEDWGASAGFSWGRCLFKYFKDCPEKKTLYWKEDPKRNPTDINGTLVWEELWHYPIQHLPAQAREMYGDNPTFFTVVRHPYARMLSEFYYHLGGNAKSTAAEMNLKVQGKLKRMLGKNCNAISDFTCYFQDYGHYISQYDFLFNTTDATIGKPPRQYVKHILHSENLNVEFNDLMKQNGLGGIIQAKGMKNACSPKDKLLTVDDFDNETIRLLNHLYQKDFEFLNYTMQKVT